MRALFAVALSVLVLGCAQRVIIPIDRNSLANIKQEDALAYLQEAARVYRHEWVAWTGRMMQMCEYYPEGVREPGGVVLPFSAWDALPSHGADVLVGPKKARILLYGYYPGVPRASPNFHCAVYVRPLDGNTEGTNEEMINLMTALVSLGVRR